MNCSLCEAQDDMLVSLTGWDKTRALQPRLLCFVVWGIFHKPPWRTAGHEGRWATGRQRTHCWAQRFADTAARAHGVLCSWALGAYCVTRPLVPSYWVTVSWGSFWSAMKRYCRSIQVQTLCFVASFSRLCFPFSVPLPFLSLPFLIIVAREGKQRKHFRNERLVCCIIKMSFVITFL